MGNSVRSSTAIESRLLTYSNGLNTFRMNYTRSTYSIRSVYISRQSLYKIYRYSVQFVISGSSSSQLKAILTDAERTLMTRGGTLTLTDADTLISAAPANAANPVAIAPPSNVDGSVRSYILTDVEWGPKPVSFTITDLSPLSAIATWTVDITTPAEDAFLIGDAVVLGIDAEVSYSIDQHHYTRRTVMGRIIVSNFDKNGPTLQKGILSQADALQIRKGIVNGQAGQNFMDPLRVPPNFVRVSENWGVDESENVLSFQITDQERYRLFPAYITDADMSNTFTVSDASATQWVSHSLEGYVEAPRDVSKERVFSAAWEMIQDALPFVGRRLDTNSAPAFVHHWSMRNYIYRNRLDFSVVVYSPFGRFDVLTSLSVVPIHSEVFFAPGEAGSAQLYGSAYRQEGGGGRRIPSAATTTEIQDPTETSGDSSQATSDISSSKDGYAKVDDGKNRLFSFNLEIHCKVNSKKYHAVPNASVIEGGSASGIESITYQTSDDEYDALLCLHTTYAIDSKDAEPPNYLNKLISSLTNEEDITVIKKWVTSGGVKKGAIGEVSLKRENYYWRIKIVGALRNAIKQSGTMEKFSFFMNSQFRLSNFDDFSDAVAKYLKAGS